METGKFVFGPLGNKCQESFILEEHLKLTVHQGQKRDQVHVQKATDTEMFIKTLSIITQSWKQTKCPSTG